MIDHDPIPALLAIASIAVALSGFSGIVLALDQMAGGSRWQEDRFRLVELLSQSAIALFGSLLAVVLLYTPLASQSIWQGLSLFWAAGALLGNGTAIWRIRNRQAGDKIRVGSVQSVVVFVSFAVLILLLIYNAFEWQLLWPVLLALTANLGFGFYQFLRIMLSAPGSI